jgi:hypothetical protein
MVFPSLHGKGMTDAYLETLHMLVGRLLLTAQAVPPPCRTIAMHIRPAKW